jgi:PAS domain S-box-containing protein
MPASVRHALLRIFAIYLGCMATVETAVWLLMPSLAPRVSPIEAALLNVSLLAIMIGPLVAWKLWSRQPPQAEPSHPRRAGLVIATTLLVWAIGMGATGIGSWHIYREELAKTASQFAMETTSLESVIRVRFSAIPPALKGLRSTYTAHQGQLDPEAFKLWVAARNVSTDVPGVRGLGFIERVPRAELPAFLARERQQQGPDFDVRTSGQASDLLVIKLIEPIANNRKAWGYDVGSEATRRAGAELAIDSGQPTLTGKITLVQDGRKRPGFLYYVPIYKPAMPVDTVAQRRTALMGLSYSPVVMDELLSEVVRPFAEHLSVRIYDSQGSDPKELLYGPDSPSPPQADQAGVQPAHTRRAGLDFGQHHLSIDMQATPAFESDHLSTMYLWFGVIGSLLSTLTAFTMWLLGVGRARAEAMVKDRTHDLRQAKAQAEAALRENQALFDALNQFTVVGVTDAQGVIQQVNDAFCKVSGYSREELIGQTHRLINAHHHPDAYWADMWQTISAGRPWRGEMCNQAKDGRLYWEHTLIAPHLGASGQVEKYVSIRLDITQMKRLEQEREQLNERLALAIDGGNDGLWDWMDTRTHAVWRSPQFYRLIGHEPAAIHTNVEALRDLLHPDDRAHTHEATQAALHSGQPFDVEYRLRCKNGSYRWFRSRAKVYRDAQGHVRRMAGAIQDIHERRLAEFELADRVAQMKAIFSLMPDGFVAFDEAGGISYVSPAFERLTGIPVELAMEANEFSLFNVLVNQALGETAATSFAELPKILDMRPPANVKLATAWHEGHGAVSKMLHLRDVTQEAELDQMKSTFMSMAAHELRTPMASIYGFTELLLTREFKPAKQRDLLQRIMRQSESMIDIINELLDLSRLEARLGRDFQMEEIWLIDLVNAVINDYKVPEGRDPPRVLPSEASTMILVDVAAARQTLLNVLSNAYKYSPGGGDVTIELPPRDPGSAHLAMTIRDSGIGMTAEQLSRMGERFYRADKSGNIPGTGLGMAIVHGTMTLMGGSVNVESELGRGTTVTLWFPASSPQILLSAGEAPADLTALTAELVAEPHTLGT